MTPIKKSSLTCLKSGLDMAKMGKLDIRELKKLQDALNDFQDPDAFMVACAKELAARLLAKVIKRTPVGQYPASSGKKGGTLRRGWTGQSKGSASNYANSLEVRHVGNVYQIDIVNPVEYASYVEYGHRTRNHRGWVKGQFMMTISEDELQKIAPKVLEKKVLDYMKKVM